MAPSPFSSYKSEGNLTTEGLNFLKNTTQNTKWNCCSISLGSGNRENTKSTFIIKDQKYSCIKSTGITKQYVCLLETRYRQIVILQASWIQDHIYFFVGELLGNVYSSGWKHPLGVGEAHESHKENIWGKVTSRENLRILGPSSPPPSICTTRIPASERERQALWVPGQLGLHVRPYLNCWGRRLWPAKLLKRFSTLWATYKSYRDLES